LSASVSSRALLEVRTTIGRDLVDQQHDRLGGGDRRQQRPRE
jgi:hypothetical protein